MHKPVFRKVAFTSKQFAQARLSPKFAFEDTHRPFVEWLFESQHKMKVLDHKLLIYDYGPKVVSITGQVGLSLGKM